MNESYFPYLPLLIGTGIVIGGVLVIFLLNALLGPKRKSVVKSQPFECGNPPSGNARRRLSVKYYLVAILFLIFDVEAVFLLPWAAEFNTFMKAPGSMPAVFLVEMFLFIIILAAALVYVLKKGVIKWEK